MKKPAELLFEYGFVNDSGLQSLSVKKRRKKLSGASGKKKKELLSKVDQETLETADGYFSKTEYPESIAHERLVYESADSSIEEHYFWILEHLRQDRGFGDILKVVDLYAASEASAFWGNQQQRITAQQNNAQGLLANIGKFVKELFQMVRELRIIDERLEIYESWKEEKEDGTVRKSESADVTLKSIFTDVVEGGTKNPQSVFGLAQTVGFTVLPDLFFNTRVYSEEELDRKIENMDINESNKNVLRRKLYQFLNWREKTHKELKNRRKFNIRYLQQHWAIIQTYIHWAKPYLKNLRRLRMDAGGDIDENPDIVSSFDQSLSEVEILARPPQEGRDVHPVVLINFQFRTRPDMNIRQEYQQGPSHMGRLEINFRSYAWSDDEIARYKQMRDREGIELIGLLDQSLEDVMDGLGEEFEDYLKELSDSIDEDEEEEEEKKTEKKTSSKSAVQDLKETFEPFTAVFGGFAEIFGLFIPKPSFGKKKSGGGGSRKGAGKTASKNMHLTYHIYKKSRRFLTW